jgi:hypothetical protein
VADPIQPSASPAQPEPELRSASACQARLRVPLSIWPAIPQPGPCPASQPPVPCPHRWPTAAAAALIAALSRPGDLVALPSPGTGVFLAAAAAASRRALGLTASAGHHHSLTALLDHGISPQQRHLALLEPGGPGALLTGSSPHAGQAALVIATACATPGCLPPAPDGSEDADADDGADERLHAACQRVLAPGGLLVVITRAARDAGYAGDLTARARAAGLSYTQHIIAMHARIAGSRLVTALPGYPAPRPPDDADPARHLTVHTDLLVFAKGACQL